MSSISSTWSGIGPHIRRSLTVGSEMSAGRIWDWVVTSREVVKSEARRRKRAVWVRAERGVIPARCEERN